MSPSQDNSGPTTEMEMDWLLFFRWYWGQTERRLYILREYMLNKKGTFTLIPPFLGTPFLSTLCKNKDLWRERNFHHFCGRTYEVSVFTSPLLSFHFRQDISSVFHFLSNLWCLLSLLCFVRSTKDSCRFLLSHHPLDGSWFFIGTFKYKLPSGLTPKMEVRKEKIYRRSKRETVRSQGIVLRQNPVPTIGDNRILL